MSYFKIALIESLGLFALEMQAIVLNKDEVAKAEEPAAAEETTKTEKTAKSGASSGTKIEKSMTNFHNPNECCPCEGVLKVVTGTESFA
jgi:hypothetical protein